MTTRDTARTLWGLVAKGEFSPETTKWLQEVAIRVLAADDQEANRRRSEMVRAVGLDGRRDAGNAWLLREIHGLPLGTLGKTPQEHRAKKEELDRILLRAHKELDADALRSRKRRRLKRAPKK